jgi:DNA-binding NarL/FixJ family response regulator
MNASAENPVRLLLVDDHPLFLEGVRSLVEEAADINVVGQASSGARALRMIADLQPDVVALDLSMPDMNGTTLAKHVAMLESRTRLVILSAHEERIFVREAMAAGARGYVLKRSAGDNLIQAIRAVSSGGLYLDPAIAERMLPMRDCPPRRLAGQIDLIQQPLTDREREVIRLVAFGYTNKEVAAKLGVTSKSVETYKTRASDKLDIRSRTKIVQYALLQGWFDNVSPQ